MKTSIVDKLKTEGWQEQFTAQLVRAREATYIREVNYE